MAFPADYTEFNHLDVSAPFDLEAMLQTISDKIDGNADGIAEVQSCVDGMCDTGGVITSENEQGWTVMV